MQCDTVTIGCRVALAYRQATTISYKHAVRYGVNKLKLCNDLHACNDNRLRSFSDKMLQRCIGLQACYDN